MKSHDKSYTTTIVINGQVVFRGRLNEYERGLAFELANDLLTRRQKADKEGK